MNVSGNDRTPNTGDDLAPFDRERLDAITTMLVETAAAEKNRKPARRVAFLVSLIVAAVLVSTGGAALALSGVNPFGAAPATTAPPATPSATPTPVPSPTPTATPVDPVPVDPTDPADPATWTIGFGGIGPITLGSTFEEQKAALTAFTDTTDPLCTEWQLNLEQPDAPTLLLNGADGASHTITTVTVVAEGPNATVPAARSPRTVAGIGIGSTLAEAQAAYPDLKQTGAYGDGSISTYYGITDGSGTWIAFNVIDGAIQRIQVGPRSVLPSEYCPA